MQKAMEESAGVQISLSMCTKIVHESIRALAEEVPAPAEPSAAPAPAEPSAAPAPAEEVPSVGGSRNQSESVGVSRPRLRLAEIDNEASEDQSTSSVEHIDEVPDDHMHWLLVSPTAPLPNGDIDNHFEGPMYGRFKVVRTNLTQREHESLLQKGWQCTFAGHGTEGERAALELREDATRGDRAHIMWVPHVDHDEEEDDVGYQPMPRAARRLARPPRSYRSEEDRARIRRQLDEDYLDYSPFERASQLMFDVPGAVQNGTETVQSGTEWYRVVQSSVTTRLSHLITLVSGWQPPPSRRGKQ
jgi:hypothetical protein